MKDAVSDVFRQVEKSTGDIIKRFEGACDKVSQHYNINTTELNDYFDKEVIEQLEKNKNGISKATNEIKRCNNVTIELK